MCPSSALLGVGGPAAGAVSSPAMGSRPGLLSASLGLAVCPSMADAGFGETQGPGRTGAGALATFRPCQDGRARAVGSAVHVSPPSPGASVFPMSAPREEGMAGCKIVSASALGGSFPPFLWHEGLEAKQSLEPDSQLGLLQPWHSPPVGNLFSRRVPRSHGLPAACASGPLPPLWAGVSPASPPDGPRPRRSRTVRLTRSPGREGTRTHGLV